jgi:nicotinamidase-related amidase
MCRPASWARRTSGTRRSRTSAAWSKGLARRRFRSFGCNTRATTSSGAAQWKIVPELSPDSGEPLVDKRYPDSFEETTLESVLADLAVGRLVVVGAQTDECVRSTLHGALVRGYDATLVSDAHTTEDLSPWGAPPPELVIAHTNLYWSNHEAPGRTAGTIEAKDVDFAAS